MCQFKHFSGSATSRTFELTQKSFAKITKNYFKYYIPKRIISLFNSRHSFVPLKLHSMNHEHKVTLNKKSKTLLLIEVFKLDLLLQVHKDHVFVRQCKWPQITVGAGLYDKGLIKVMLVHTHRLVPDVHWLIASRYALCFISHLPLICCSLACFLSLSPAHAHTHGHSASRIRGKPVICAVKGCAEGSGTTAHAAINQSPPNRLLEKLLRYLTPTHLLYPLYPDHLNSVRNI